MLGGPPEGTILAQAGHEQASGTRAAGEQRQALRRPVAAALLASIPMHLDEDAHKGDAGVDQRAHRADEPAGSSRAWRMGSVHGQVRALLGGGSSAACAERPGDLAAHARGSRRHSRHDGERVEVLELRMAEVA